MPEGRSCSRLLPLYGQLHGFVAARRPRCQTTLGVGAQMRNRNKRRCFCSGKRGGTHRNSGGAKLCSAAVPGWGRAQQNPSAAVRTGLQGPGGGTKCSSITQILLLSTVAAVRKDSSIGFRRRTPPVQTCPPCQEQVFPPSPSSEAMNYVVLGLWLPAAQHRPRSFCSFSLRRGHSFKCQGARGLAVLHPRRGKPGAGGVCERAAPVTSRISLGKSQRLPATGRRTRMP